MKIKRARDYQRMQIFLSQNIYYLQYKMSDVKIKTRIQWFVSINSQNNPSDKNESIKIDGVNERQPLTTSIVLLTDHF